MQAVILAGGKGTRLRPYTTILPKPLMPIGNYPILEIVIRQLKANGFDEIILAVGYLSQIIEAYFGDGSKWGVKIYYSREDKALGTAAPLKLVEKMHPLNDHFLVMNGDILTDFNYRSLVDYHLKNKGLATISMHKRKVDITLGVIKSDENNNLQDYIEKPSYHFDVSMGIYMFSKEVLQFIDPDTYFDFPHLIQRLISKDLSVKCFPFEGKWFDIGRQEDYEEALECITSDNPDLLS